MSETQHPRDPEGVEVERVGSADVPAGAPVIDAEIVGTTQRK
jgi:hypothetical protein